MVPQDLSYTAEHEWARSEADGTVRVGITDFAQEALGDVVFVSLPAVGAQVSAGQVLGEVESTKSVSELFAPVDGEIVSVNNAVADSPELQRFLRGAQAWMAGGFEWHSTSDRYK